MGTVLLVVLQDISKMKNVSIIFKWFFIITIVLGLCVGIYTDSYAKKITQKLKIKEDKKQKKKIENQKKDDYREFTVCSADSLKYIDEDGNVFLLNTRDFKFAGYEKEPNASVESFLILNGSVHTLRKASFNIIYMDMKGRMLHKRNVTVDCNIPPSESRKFDIKSWDSQKTYFYHLGNAPKKTATPYDVKFEAISFTLE